MHLTVSVIAKSNRQSRRRKDESVNAYLGRLTNVAVTGQRISKIDNLQHCPQLATLYLHDNCIARLENLSACQRITHLYLQHNNISRIEHLSHLRGLTKLHLGYNCIGVIEGLEGLFSLRELHVEHQRLPTGEKLLFDPRSLESVSSLRILNVAGNNLDALDDLLDFHSLSALDVSFNRIHDLSDVLFVLRSCPGISSLNVTGNSFCELSKYREEIIVSTSSLALLDGREVSASLRQFLLRWKSAIESRRQHSSPSRRDYTATLEGAIPVLRQQVPPARIYPGLSGSLARYNRATVRAPRLLPPLEHGPVLIGGDL